MGKVGGLKEMQEIENIVQETKQTQPEIAQPKENEKIGEYVLGLEKEILVIYADAKEEKERKDGRI